MKMPSRGGCLRLWSGADGPSARAIETTAPSASASDRSGASDCVGAGEDIVAGPDLFDDRRPGGRDGAATQALRDLAAQPQVCGAVHAHATIRLLGHDVNALAARRRGVGHRSFEVQPLNVRGATARIPSLGACSVATSLSGSQAR